MKNKLRMVHHCNGKVFITYHRTWFGAIMQWLYQYLFNKEKGRIQKVGYHYYD